jgi:RNA polymerase sigma-70 factor (ECF subfamily)
VREEAAVDDVTQEVFVVALRRLPEFQGRSSPKTWLFGILRNVVMKHHRTVKRRQPIPSSTDVDAVEGPTTGPQTRMEKAQARDVVALLLEQLDTTKREVFILAELEQMSAPEIAEATGANLTTVYARLRDARRDFQAALNRFRAKSGWRGE